MKWSKSSKIKENGLFVSLYRNSRGKILFPVVCKHKCGEWSFNGKKVSTPDYCWDSPIDSDETVKWLGKSSGWVNDIEG